MSTTNGGKLISEMNAFLNDSEVLTDSVSENELPFESLDDFSTDPLGFNELALKMLNRVEGVFDLAVKYNRHSSRYLQCCAHLEKGIKYLGSACLTKIALQKQKHTFPALGQLSTEKLYRMVSFHFRKLDAALTEYQQKHHELNDKLLDMQLRYFSLLQRLCATEERIYKYNERSFTEVKEDYSPVVRGLAFSGKSWSRSIHEQYDEPASFRNFSSFSPMQVLGVGKMGAGEEGIRLESEVRSNDARDIAPAPEQQDEGLSLHGTVAEKSITDDGAVCAGQDGEHALGGDVSDPAAVSEQSLEGTTLDDAEKDVLDDGAVCAGQDGEHALGGDVSDPAAVSGQSQEGTGLDEAAVSEADGSEEDDDLTMITEPNFSPSSIIMSQVIARSVEAGDGMLSFTEEEMRILLSDPEFREYRPHLAAQMRDFLAEIDSG